MEERLITRRKRRSSSALITDRNERVVVIKGIGEMEGRPIDIVHLFLNVKHSSKKRREKTGGRIENRWAVSVRETQVGRLNPRLSTEYTDTWQDSRGHVLHLDRQR